jgi:hypothetical protein
MADNDEYVYSKYLKGYGLVKSGTGLTADDFSGPAVAGDADVAAALALGVTDAKLTEPRNQTAVLAAIKRLRGG